MKTGDKLQFKRIRWVLTARKVSSFGIVFYKYKVYRKYFKKIWLNNTNCTYDILPDYWNYTKKMLKKNKNYYYTQCGK